MNTPLMCRLYHTCPAHAGETLTIGKTNYTVAEDGSLRKISLMFRERRGSTRAERRQVKAERRAQRMAA